MKRQKHKAKRSRSTRPGSSSGPGNAPVSTARRNFLATLRNGTLVAAIAGGGGWFLVQHVSATIAEHDLSQIGNGIPSVVQIHDPQCSRCVALQREARSAMTAFKAEELQFLVANIRNATGRRLADTHGVGHVTLLLFDGKGKRRDVLVGSNTSDFLSQAFRRHVDVSGSS